MWERLHVQITKAQMKWLRAEALTRGKSIGEVVRRLIDAAMSRQKQKSESENSTRKPETSTK